MFEATKIGQKLPWNYKRYLLGLLIFGLGCSKSLISNYFSPYIFNPIAFFLRSISGKINFAMGEWAYLIICMLLIIKVINLIRTIKAPLATFFFWKHFLVRTFNGAVTLYIVFQLIWGFNYQKESPARDFHLVEVTSYTEAQMDSLSLALIDQMNATRLKMADSSILSLHFDPILGKTLAAYGEIAKQYPFLHYQKPSLKKAYFPSWGDYIGYTAFYQPITGEAIVRADLPKLTLPFTVSHEIAHQLGYASEAEANFIAYVIGIESKDPLFQYSTQLQLFSYAQNAELMLIAKRGDSTQFQNVVSRNKQLVSATVLADRKQIRDFFTRKQHLQMQGATQIYDQFLRWNKQEKGVESYNDVLLWVLSYGHKKILSNH